MRATGGYGQYAYQAIRGVGGTPTNVRFRGQQTYAKVLIGYQWQWGPLTAKVFGGFGGLDHRITPGDPKNEVSGKDFGAEGALELWWAISPAFWASLDVASSQVFKSHTARLKAGYRLTPDLSVGVESGIDGHQSYRTKRAGVFVRNEWRPTDWAGLALAGGEMTLAAGLAGEALDDPSAYVRADLLLRY